MADKVSLAGCGQRLFKCDNDLIDRQTIAFRCLNRGNHAITLGTQNVLHFHGFDKLMPEKVVPDMSKYLLCPMPGLVISIPVEVGQDIKAGETLAIVEAMKMQNILRAERDGVIASIEAAEGDSLAVDEIIIAFE